MSQGLPLGIIYLLEIPQKNAGVTSANYTLIMNMKKVGIVDFLSRHLGNYGILFYKPVYDWFIVYFTCTVIGNTSFHSDKITADEVFIFELPKTEI